MTPTTFPCPFCGRKMGVGPDLLGHKVRCPHCKQVILAPAAVPAPDAPPLAVAVPPPPPPPPPVVVVSVPAPGQPPELPVFNLPTPEAQDSIFGEAVEEGDEVFGSDPGRLPVPEMPPPVAPPPPVAAYQSPPASPPAPPPAAVPAPPAAYTAPPADPFAVFTAVPAYAPPAAVPVPVTPPPVAAAAYPPPPVVPANPWDGFDQAAAPAPQAAYAAPPAAYPAPPPAAYPQQVADSEPLPAAIVDDEPMPEPRRGSRDRRPDGDERRPRSERGRSAEKGASGGAATLFKVGLFVLIPYAFLTTVLAIYGLFIREGGKVPDGHPLSLIPDSRGEYPPADRKKTGKLGVPVDGPLPPELRAGLGGKVTVGAVEVEPVAVTVRKLKLVRARDTGKTDTATLGKGVVLTIKVRNSSSDLSFHPLDPAFNRKEYPTDSPPTVLVLGKGATYAGGAVKWPYERGMRRAYEEAQEDEDKPLGPGESRTYVVTSDARSDVVRAVQNAKDSILWRVQIRRGLVEYRGREVPVTTLVGVEFKSSDVTTED